MKLSSAVALLSLAVPAANAQRRLSGSGSRSGSGKKKGKKGMDKITVYTSNLSERQIMSGMFFAAHDCSIKLFEFGEKASDELAFLAENGSPMMLVDKFAAYGDDMVCDVGSLDSPTLPGQTNNVDIEPGHCDCISTASMFVSTNDAFVGLNAYPLDDYGYGGGYGSYGGIFLPAFDAGSEGNSENCTHIPGPPCGTGPNNTNAGDGEGYVHVSRGIGGDVEVPNRYDWRNPSIRVMIKKGDYHREL